MSRGEYYVKKNLMVLLKAFLFTVSLVLLFPHEKSVSAASTFTLPGGASSLQETYQDWRVTCVSEQVTSCVMVQQQVDAESGRRLLAVEIGVAEAGEVTGVLLLPFGLALGEGVAPQVDDGSPGSPLSFSTCLPAGCLVPIALDAKTTADFRKGGVLTLSAQAVGGEEIAFSISLNGFAAALDRLTSLVK